MIEVLPITNGFYRSESLPVSAQQAINCYTAMAEVPSLVQEYVIGIPGIELINANAGANRQGRGFHVMSGIAYSVNGTGLYRLNADDTVTSLGTITGTADVSMDDNGAQLMILVPGSTGYIYTALTGVLVAITDPGFTANGNPQYVVFNDSYFVCTTDEKKFIKSAPNDGLTWDALDFGSAESDPDAVTAPAKYKNQVMIFGVSTIEVEQNVGGDGFPYQRSGQFFDKGTSSPLSIINAQDTLMFAGSGINETTAIWAIAGNALQKISTNAIDSLLETLTDTEIASIRAWTYGQKGSYFVGFALPTTTIVYEMATKKWHERQSYLSSMLTTYRVHSIVTAYGKIICNDIVDGRFGRIDPDIYSEYDEIIIKKIITQPFADKMLSLFFPMLELTVEAGVGNSDAPDPVVELERSTDGGATWSYSRPRAMGRVGERERRAIWRRNGRAKRYECFRFTHSDMTKFVAIQLRADVYEGVK